MRRRSLVGSGVVLVAVIAAVVLLRTHPAPVGQNYAAPPTVPPPVTDARAMHLTTVFDHIGQLPANVMTAGLSFRRYTDPEPGLDATEYSATGVLAIRGGPVLDQVSVTVTRIIDTDRQLDFGHCDPTGSHDGSSCTQQTFPNGTHAKVVRNAAFAQTAASPATTGVRPGIQTQLDAVYADGTFLVVTLDADNGAGIPLDDADMMRLAGIQGVTGS